jgi:hypothetical protein
MEYWHSRSCNFCGWNILVDTCARQIIILGRFQHCVSKGWFSVSDQKHRELVSQMRTAKYKDNGNLDKAETSTSTFDVFDSTRLALKMFELNIKKEVIS